MNMRVIILATVLISASAWADPAQHLARGNAWRALDEFGAALAAYDAGLREASGHAGLLADLLADLLAERALTLHRLGETDAARAMLSQAIAAAGPRNAAPFTARAGLSLLAGQDAATDLAEALARAPNDARAMDLQRLAQARRGSGAAPDARRMEGLRHAFGPWLAE